MSILLSDQAIRGRGGLVLHLPMGAGHEQALAQVVREFGADPYGAAASRASSIALDDGDLIWHRSGGREILFTVVDVSGRVLVRALENGSDGWTVVASQPVDLHDATGTARTILRLMSLLTV